MRKIEDNDHNLNPGLDSVIEEVKKEFKGLGSRSKDLIIKLGNELEKTVRQSEDICEEIKNILNEEIAEGLISRRNIERYCRENWKKKRRPKKQVENDTLSLSEQKKLLPPLVVSTRGNASSEDQDLNGGGNNFSNPNLDLEEIEMDDIDSCDIKNFDLDKEDKNNKDHLEFEISLRSRVLHKYLEDLRRGANKILIHGTIQRSTLKVISARLERPLNQY